MYANFVAFISHVEEGKTFIWFHPKWVMMDWESYRSLGGMSYGNTMRQVIVDEAANYNGKKIPIARTWSRKGRCPYCDCGFGSKHKLKCIYKRK